MTPRQELFVKEYLVDLNGTQAAIRAGYSKERADARGSALLKRPDVQAAIREGKKVRLDRIDIDQDWVIEELKINLRLSRESEQYAAANKALELMGRHLGMFKEGGLSVNIDNRRVNIDNRQVVKITREEAKRRVEGFVRPDAIETMKLYKQVMDSTITCDDYERMTDPLYGVEVERTPEEAAAWYQEWKKQVHEEGDQQQALLAWVKDAK